MEVRAARLSTYGVLASVMIAEAYGNEAEALIGRRFRRS